MGAWNSSSFENDDAADWLFELEESVGLGVLESVLGAAELDYLEAPDGSIIIAAAEVLLAMQGKARTGIPEGAKEWSSKNSNLDSAGLNTKMVTALDVVLSSKSELKELWQDSEDYEEWLKDVQEIKANLQS